MIHKVEKHEREITHLRGDFDKFRYNTNKKLDDIIIKIGKPPFTSAQVTSFIFLLMSYMVGIMMYSEGIKSDVRVNTIENQNAKEMRKLQSLQFDKIINSLDLIHIDIAVLKSESE